MIYINLQGWFG